MAQIPYAAVHRECHEFLISVDVSHGDVGDTLLVVQNKGNIAS